MNLIRLIIRIIVTRNIKLLKSPVERVGPIASTSFPIRAGTDTPSIMVVIIRVIPNPNDRLLASKIGSTLRNQFLV